ncbi:InlB B-repeat-containing protein [Lactobacillus sp. YT155]|uniref:leucine-rich repeat domain-containing protein n=1 Tax=Lactobacillus sp. YT155 TaxID=3060955 RepID=UPI00265ED6CE|nr:leucine-rich repeat domain-containing protein [Lactobacillus sp. YT155]MDO1605129.1 InlB B-repeat-containing protein [Lactobacillus sp. YT155]
MQSKKNLGKASIEATVTQAELDSITNLIASSAEISDLQGLEHLNNVESLSLGGNDFTDLTPVSNLKKLTYLQVEQNYNLTSLAPISQLTNLQTLRASYTSVSDLTPLANLTALTDLVLFDTQVTDVTPLKNLVNLETLHVVNGEGGPKDISALKDLPKLSFLNLRYSRVLDLSVFADGFNALATLQLHDIWDEVGELRVDANNKPIQSVTNAVIGYGGEPLTPIDITDEGTYDAATNSISWPTLTDEDEVVEYSVRTTFEKNGKVFPFTATVSVPVVRPTAITFVTNGGETLPDMQVYAGDTFGTLPTPKKAGNEFVGWFYDEALTKPASATDVVPDSPETLSGKMTTYSTAGNITLYAKWKTAAVAKPTDPKVKEVVKTATAKKLPQTGAENTSSVVLTALGLGALITGAYVLNRKRI